VPGAAVALDAPLAFALFEVVEVVPGRPASLGLGQECPMGSGPPPWRVAPEGLTVFLI